MDIRTAILKAAHQVEMRPETFNFMETRPPKDCGSPGYARGWIGFFTGGEAYKETAQNVLGMHHYKFYDRMTELSDNWRENAADCATGLRLYADRYHPAATPLDWEALSKPNAAVMATVTP